MRFMAKGSKLMLQTENQIPSMTLPVANSNPSAIQSAQPRKRKFTVLSDDAFVPQPVENTLVPGRISFQAFLLPQIKETVSVSEKAGLAAGSSKNQSDQKKGKKDKKKKKKQPFESMKANSHPSNQKKQKQMMIFK
jgi:hypothetical protein